MAGEPALDKVGAALKEALQASEAFDGVLIDVDRPDDDEYGNTEIERGAINIVHDSTAFQHGSYGEHANATLHTASFDLDMITAVKAAASNARRLREMEADAVAALALDLTLGGLVSDVNWLSAGGGEDVRADVAVRPLRLEIEFATPLGDHRTVIGAAGLIP